MKINRKISVCTVIGVVALFLIATSGSAQEPKPGANPVDRDAVFTPAPGTPLRKAILDALRQNVQSWSKLEVVFVVDDLKVKSDWAWVHTRPQSKDGQSHYEDILALMQRRDGVWMVAELVCTEEDNPECIDSPDYFSKLKERFPGVPEDILPAPEEMEENVENMQ